MKILRIAQKIYPDVTGGGPYHVHALSRDQAKLGHDVTVVTIRSDGDLPKVEERDGYTIVRYDPVANVLGNEISIDLARDMVNFEKYDLIHAHSHLYFSTNLAGLKRRFGDIPLAITSHGLYSQTVPEHVFDIYLKTLGRYTFNSADLVFTYTEKERKELRELGVKTDVEVVPNGVDVGRFQPDGPESELISSEGPVVLFVGRLVDGKQPATVITAFESVRETYPDAELYLCGDGPLRSELEAQVREAGISTAVTFLGVVPYDEMPKVYRSATVVALSSRTEGMPRAVMEAMATGTPVVSTNLPQLEKSLTRDSEVVPLGDTEAFSRGIYNIINGSSECDVGGDGRDVATREFAWEDTVISTTNNLQRLVG